MTAFRARFAPSPTGALHIGGVRTALYNYLLAQQLGGTFILRIEDTDQTRYVADAEKYILNALKWCGITPKEGPGIGGEYGPYRQSERKAIYAKYAEQLVASGNAYYAFDSAEALAEKRAAYEAEKKTFRYDGSVRNMLDNSLNMSTEELEARLAEGTPYTVRLKVPADQTVHIQDLVRGEVQFNSNELDDKIMLKADGMPTYHLANVVDDYLMKISHVIRGEEWLPSTAHHVLLYQAFGWADAMPKFAHLPLILKPNGKGKLSKRDGAKFGFPVFPLSWKGKTEEESFIGFQEFGFLPEAVNNFLAFLGWNPGTEQEIFSLEELIQAFDSERIQKAGARFDIEKAKWFNQQYIIATEDAALAKMVRPLIEAKGHQPTEAFLTTFCGLMKERVTLLPEFWENGYYFFEDIKEYERKPVKKKWKAPMRPNFDKLVELLDTIVPFNATTIEQEVRGFIEQHELRMGDILQVFRLAISGTLKGPSVYDMAALLGKKETLRRFEIAYQRFDEMTQS
ncbi:MAG: glutamate--tRNA ligase [Bacteroidota bacterium]